MLRAATLLIILACSAEVAIGQTVLRAFCGDDGRAHVVYAGGLERTMPPEEKQVGCSDIGVAEDGRTVGWAIQVDNCCTSYPISIAVVLLKDDQKTLLPSSQMLWRWRFVDQGKLVAMLTGPVHGSASEAKLYDSHTAKLLKTWYGSGKAPKWVRGWEEEFAPGTEERN